ncbi:MAG: YjgN family protein [Proteobacteria bacterium]|nr:YjgN family protein [Pseudomonadota bacterium]
MIRCMPFRFDGKASEFFKIWIVNIFLSIITLGIYSAWAKVRTLRYFYGNTWLDNNSFSYLADPVKILKGRIIAVTALIIYFFTWEIFPQAGFWFLAIGVLLFPAIMVMALSFHMNNSAYRSIRFSFKKDFRKIYVLFLAPILSVLALTWIGYSLLESADFIAELEKQEETGFRKEDLLPTVFILCLMPLLPYLDYLRTRFIIDQTRYGKSDASFAAGAWKFYRIYLIAFFSFMAIAVVVSLAMGALVAIIGVKPDDPESIGKEIGWIAILSMVAIYGSSFFITGYIRAVRTNMVFNNTAFGQDTFNSKLKTMPVSWIYISNTIAIIGSVGLLIPWAQIRMARYIADNTEFESSTLDEIQATPESKQSALGEEFGDAFDLDIGL